MSGNGEGGGFFFFNLIVLVPRRLPPRVNLKGDLDRGRRSRRSGIRSSYSKVNPQIEGRRCRRRRDWLRIVSRSRQGHDVHAVPRAAGPNGGSPLGKDRGWDCGNVVAIEGRVATNSRTSKQTDERKTLLDGLGLWGGKNAELHRGTKGSRHKEQNTVRKVDAEIEKAPRWGRKVLLRKPSPATEERRR